MDLFLNTLLALALALGAAALIGTRLPRSHLAASRVRLAAPPERVFAIVTDFAGYPAWRPGLDRVEPGPDIDGLPSWYEICARFGRVHFRVAAMAPPHGLVTCLADDRVPLSGRWTYRFEADGEGTLLTLTEHESIHHPLLRFFDRFVLTYHGVMDVYLVALARKLGGSARPEHLSLPRDPV